MFKDYVILLNIILFIHPIPTYNFYSLFDGVKSSLSHYFSDWNLLKL